VELIVSLEKLIHLYMFIEIISTKVLNSKLMGNTSSVSYEQILPEYQEPPKEWISASLEREYAKHIVFYERHSHGHIVVSDANSANGLVIVIYRKVGKTDAYMEFRRMRALSGGEFGETYRINVRDYEALYKRLSLTSMMRSITSVKKDFL